MPRKCPDCSQDPLVHGKCPQCGFERNTDASYLLKREELPLAKVRADNPRVNKVRLSSRDTGA